MIPMAYPPTVPGPATMIPPNPNVSRPSDRDGVSHLKVAALLGVLVQAMFWFGFAIFYLIYLALQNTASNLAAGRAVGASIPSWITPTTVYAAIGLLAGGLVLGVVGFIFFYLGFRTIRRGAPDFGAPTALMIVGLVGFAMMAIGVLILIGGVLSAVNSAIGGSSGALALSAILGAIALFGIGSLLALVGVIGLVLGNWRAGSRYEESTVKVGSILTIIPYVSIVGYILLLVGYSKASSKLSSGWVPPSDAAMGMGYAPPAYAGAMAPPGMTPPPPMAPPMAAPVCPTCGQPASWIAQYTRWYCPRDQKYL